MDRKYKAKHTEKESDKLTTDLHLFCIYLLLRLMSVKWWVEMNFSALSKVVLRCLNGTWFSILEQNLLVQTFTKIQTQLNKAAFNNMEWIRLLMNWSWLKTCHDAQQEEKYILLSPAYENEGVKKEQCGWSTQVKGAQATNLRENFTKLDT